MNKIYITGSTGFVGKYIVNYFNSKYEFCNYSKTEEINIEQEIVLHFAGKAHDHKNSNYVDEYYKVNTELTKRVFNAFLASDAKIFITLSSVKAITDKVDIDLIEEYIPNPITHYGKSKLLAEKYILSKLIPEGKKVYI